MKRAVCWAGAAIMAAALTMVLADIAQAAPGAIPARRDELIVKFDLLSPPGITCTASGQGIDSRVTRGLTGNPVVRVLGDVRGADIICTLPDGGRWRVATGGNLPFTPSEATWLTVFVRPGKAVMGGLVEIGHHPRSVYESNTFVPAD